MSAKWTACQPALLNAISAEVNFTSAEYARITARLNAQGYGPFTVGAVT